MMLTHTTTHDGRLSFVRANEYLEDLNLNLWNRWRTAGAYAYGARGWLVDNPKVRVLLDVTQCSS